MWWWSVRFRFVLNPVFVLSVLVMLWEVGFRCGPNRGNRWIHLAFLGRAYVVVEVLFFTVKTLYGERRQVSG